MVGNSDYKAMNRTLDEDGFVVWPGLIPEQLIDAHLSALEALMQELGAGTERGSEQMPRERVREIKEERQRFHRECLPALELIFNPALIQFLEHRFGDEAVMRQPQTGYYQQHTPAHTESLDIKPDRRDAEIRVWCALEDVNPAAGPVYYIPQSHKLIAWGLEEEVCRRYPEFIDVLKGLAGPTTLEGYGAATGPFFSKMKIEIIPELVRQSGLKPVAPELKKGDIVIFRSDVVHGTCDCVDPLLTRKYLTAFWAAGRTRWYHTRAWWGPDWDFRLPENSITAPIERFGFGSRIEFADYRRAHLAAFARAIRTSPEPALPTTLAETAKFSA